MKERASYFGRVLARSVGMDARANAHGALKNQGTPRDSAILLTGLLTFLEIAAPATGRAVVSDTTSDIDSWDVKNALNVSGGALLDTLLWTIQLSTTSSLPILFAERAGTNVGVHLAADSLQYGKQRLKTLFKSR